MAFEQLLQATYNPQEAILMLLFLNLFPFYLLKGNYYAIIRMVLLFCYKILTFNSVLGKIVVVLVKYIALFSWVITKFCSSNVCAFLTNDIQLAASANSISMILIVVVV